MKLTNVSVFSILLLMGCDSHRNKSEIVGKWREDKKLTLNSIEESKRTDDKTKNFYKNDRTLGNSIMEFGQNQSRIMVVDSGEGYDFTDKFRDYEVLEERANFFKIESYDIFFEKPTVKKYYRKGNCFYEYHEVRDRKTYFCKVND